MASYSLVVFIEGRTNKANSCSYMSGFATAEIAQAALESIKAGLPGVDVRGTILGQETEGYWTPPPEGSSPPSPALDLTTVETILAAIRDQPDNALTDTQLRATALPVSGAFYPATQPVSGTVTASVSNFPATQPISGTVTATGPLTDTQLRAVAVPVSGPLTDTQLRASPLVTTDRTDITFYAHFDRIVPAANKYMAVVFNTSAVKKIVFKRIEVMFRGAAAVTGVVLDQYLTKIDATTAGTVITPFAEDPSDPLAAGITCSHNDSGVFENHIIKRFTATSEESKIGAAMAEDAGTFGSIVLYEAAPGTRGLTSRQNKGIAIRNLTNSTVGTVSYFFLFTVQDA